MMRTKNKGVALISALIVVALATTAAATLTASQQLGLRRAENLIGRDQAWQYLVAAEEWVGMLLRRDAEETQTDHLDEPWAQSLPPLPVDGGSLSGQLTDLTGLLNLNEVVTGDGKVSTVHQERLRRLLQALELPTELLDPLVDWIDGNDEPFSPAGAEDTYYLGLEKPYRTANRPLASTSELLLLRGIDVETFDKLSPFVSTLQETVPINVNTAPLEILMALGLERADAEAVVETRPFDKIEDFNQMDVVKKAQVSPDGLVVNSTFFLLKAQANIGRASIRQYSTLRRDEGKITIVSRSLGTQ